MEAKTTTTYSMWSLFRNCRKACEWRYIAGLQSDYAANGVHHPDTNPTGEVLDPGYLYEVKNIPDFNKTSDTRVELVGVIKI